jgi:hypothetical protein
MLKLSFTVVGLFAFIAYVAPCGARAEDPGLELGRIRELRLSGRIFDARTGEPLRNAQVTVDTPYDRKRITVGPDGLFALTVEEPQGLGLVTIVFDHEPYRQKYLETAYGELFEKRAEIVISNRGLAFAAKNAKLDLGCSARGSVDTALDTPAELAAVCERGLSGVELVARTNRMVLLGDGPFTLRLGGGRLEVRDTAVSSLTVRVDVPLFPR